MSKPVHRLILIDRGAVHRHRFVTNCSCGDFNGVPCRRKKEATRQHRNHVRMVTIRRAAVKALAPRATTPVDRLPQELR